MVTAQNLLKIKEFEDLIIRYNQRLEEEVRSRTYDIETYAKDLEKEVEKRTEELTVSNKYLEKANRAKSEFLATMSHELRTPFSSIIGFSEILQDEKFGKLNEKQAGHVTNILTSGRHLLELINDLLDLSKIESGRMTLTLNKFSFPKLIEGIETILKEQALRKNITIRSRIASDITIINADERKIKQIMYNLLSNAVKFTPDGGKVDIKVDIKDEELRVSVTDTGIGIKQEDMDKLFKAFQQIDSKYVRKYGGTGLGLSLTKEMVKLHGGEIWVKSESGKGSTFTFTISLRKNKV
jgi:signal transduction histidine kinase